MKRQSQNQSKNFWRQNKYLNVKKNWLKKQIKKVLTKGQSMQIAAFELDCDIPGTQGKQLVPAIVAW